jgi:1-phosphatidylinositol-3-phosphate 5-kinase
VSPLLLQFMKSFPSLWQMKRVIGGGGAEDSSVIDGVVLRKNVAHKRMRTSVPHARVMVLAGALESQRSPSKLSSFDTLIDQVRDACSIRAARI